MTSTHNWKRAALTVTIGAALTFAGCGGGGNDNADTGADNAGGNRPPVTYAVGGAVSGLAGSGLVLQNNGGDDRAIAADGHFVFTTKLATGATYAVTVKTQPTNPAQTCTVSKGSGAIATADVQDVVVACTTVAGGGGGGGGGSPPGYYAGNFIFDGTYDQGRGVYTGEAQLRFNFEGDVPNERRYRLGTASALFTKSEHDSATDLCILKADSDIPMAFDGYLIFNHANSTYAITGGLLVFQATSTCTDKRSGFVSVARTIMNVLVTSAELPADPGYLPVVGDGAVITGSRTYVGAQNVLTQRNQWRLDRR